MIITRTPLRISFFGGGTDYPAWYRENGGAVLATTINKYCYLSCRYQPAFFESRYRVAYRNIELCSRIEDIKHPSVRGCLAHSGIQKGMEIVYAGDLPARSGLGSSSAFTVGLLNALHALRGRMVSKTDLAHEAIHVEQNVIREPVGSQDQVMAAYGGLKLVRFGDRIEAEPVVLSADRLKALQSHLMLFYTGVSRFGAAITQDKIDNIPNRSLELRQMQELVPEALSRLTSGAPLAEFGQLLNETWELKQSLSNKISTPLVEEAYAKALAHGALGGKLLGAGGGGFLLFCVPPGLRGRVKKALYPLLHIPFAFENQGSRVLHFEYAEEPSELDEWDASEEELSPLILAKNG